MVLLNGRIGRATYFFENESSEPTIKYSFQSFTTPNLTNITYREYIDMWRNVGYTGDCIILDGKDFINGRNVVQTENLAGKNAVISGEEGFIEWRFKVEKKGLYSIKVEYYPIEGTGGNIERTILIDGKLPFKEAYGVIFSRLYKDESMVKEDKNGDDIRPGQIEEPKWMISYVCDSNGYFGDRLYFYLSEGTHILTMESVKEPMGIARIILESVDSNIKSYDEVYKEFLGKGASNVKGVLEDGILIVQAEHSYLKSDPSLYPISDNTSPATQPFDYKKRRINSIGGEQWKYPRQWISWKVYVPRSGFYNIGLRFKQNFVRDIYCNRTLYIDGAIPFEEAQNIHFYFDNKWQVKLIGDNKPYFFYLEEGEHEFKLEVTAGDLSNILIKVSEILATLNEVNLKLIELMGTAPDPDRDYQIDKYMPEVIITLKQQKEIIDSIVNELLAKTNNRDSLISRLEQLSEQINRMVNQPYKIPSLFNRFRSSVGALGNWIVEVREQPLIIDFIFLAEEGAEMPRAEASLWENIKAGVWNFINSFSKNYLTVATEIDGKKPITVWIGSGLTGGRDQAITLSQLVDQEFVPKYNIPVNLQLVPVSTILPAILAGRGPDVALQLPSNSSSEGQTITPVELAMRNAVYDLSKFEDFEEVIKRFPESSLTPYKYRGGVYALPETLVFPMMFCRIDILSELGIKIDELETWEDIVNILPILQAKNMTFGLPSTPNTYSIFLHQMGGEYYYKDGEKSALDSEIALEAFKFWMEFYNEYGLIRDYSFENRFRTGEMPIGIADYTMYNLLSISAPEISGLWVMVQIPGIKDVNGNINNIAPCSGAGCVLISSSSNKEEAWEFMKWWTSAEVQYSYGRELEAVMGPAARYNTANVEALIRLPWAAMDRKNLLAQFEKLKGIPQVPGGYSTERNLNFARASVLNNKTEPRETLLKYVEEINKELEYKRREFGLMSD